MIVSIGIDNGTSGSIGIISSLLPDGSFKEAVQYSMPCFDTEDYTKAKKRIKRIQVSELIELLSPFVIGNFGSASVLIEKPFVNPKIFNATLSAVRAHEATLIALEIMGFRQGYEIQFTESRTWQKVILAGVSGRDDLKTASTQYVDQLYPGARKGCEDGDGLCIAHFLHFHGGIV